MVGFSPRRRLWHHVTDIVHDLDCSFDSPRDKCRYRYRFEGDTPHSAEFDYLASSGRGGRRNDYAGSSVAGETSASLILRSNVSFRKSCCEAALTVDLPLGLSTPEVTFGHNAPLGTIRSLGRLLAKIMKGALAAEDFGRGPVARIGVASAEQIEMVQ